MVRLNISSGGLGVPLPEDNYKKVPSEVNIGADELLQY